MLERSVPFDMRSVLETTVGGGHELLILYDLKQDINASFIACRRAKYSGTPVMDGPARSIQRMGFIAFPLILFLQILPQKVHVPSLYSATQVRQTFPVSRSKLKKPLVPFTPYIA